MRPRQGTAPARALACAASVVLGTVVAAQQPAPPDLNQLLSAVSARVEAYYARAQSIVCTETVRLQPIDSDWTPRDLGRTLVYDLRVEWDQAADGDARSEPTVRRQLRTVNGRPPRPKDEPGCMDPKPVSPDALAFLLPLHRDEYLFKFAGGGQIDKHSALKIEYRGRTPGPADVKWKGNCVSIDLPGHFRGRVWVDAATDDVLRVDEQLIGLYDVPVPRDRASFAAATAMVVERADTSTRYRPVAFHDPDETLVLPESIETYQVIRNAGVPRLRMTQTFTNYQRFLTGGRLVKPGSH